MRHRLLPLFIALIIALLLPAASLSAYDQTWGARLDLNMELPAIYGSSLAVNTGNTLSFEYRGTWGREANVQFDGGVAFDGDAIFGLNTATELSWLGFFYDIYPIFDELNFYGHIANYGYTAGRQVSGDPAGLIFNAPFDGVEGSIDLGEHIITAGFGLTGLTTRLSSQYYLTEADTKKDGILSASRILQYVAWNMPAATEWTGLSAYFLAVQDLTSDADLADYGTDKFHPLYLELMARGFLNEDFLYSVSLVGQYGSYGDASVLAGIGRLEFSWLPGDHSRLGVDILASSGDDWGRGQYLLGTTAESKLYQYIPLSIVSTQGYVVEFEVGNLVSLGALYASRPSRNFSWELRTTTFLRSALGPVSTSLVPATSDQGRFMGQEGLMSFFWRPRSDFGWDLKFGLFYPGDPIVVDSYVQEFYLDNFPLLFRIGFDWSWSF
jgi:hypothetical protein